MTDDQTTFTRATLEYDEAHDDAAMIMSLALQHHVNIEVVQHSVTRNNSGEAASLLGATVDCLATASVRAAGGPGMAETTFAKATLEYDAEHEWALLEAIFETSRVSDANAIVVRTGEIAAALITASACTLATSPSAIHTSAAIRKVLEDIGKSLRRQVASAEENVDIQEFLKRSLSGDYVGGNP